MYLVDDEGSQAKSVMLLAGHIFLSLQVEATSIIIETGSTHNLVGSNLIPVLTRRMEDKGKKLQLENCIKYFKFVGHEDTPANQRLKFTEPCGHNQDYRHACDPGKDTFPSWRKHPEVNGGQN